MIDLVYSLSDSIYRENVAGVNAVSALWNGSVHPFLRMTIFGVAWYQGLLFIRFTIGMMFYVDKSHNKVVCDSW